MFQLTHGKYQRFDSWNEFLAELRKPSRKIRIVSSVFAKPLSSYSYTRLDPGACTTMITGLPFSPTAKFDQGEVAINSGNFKAFEIAASGGFDGYGRINGAQ